MSASQIAALKHQHTLLKEALDALSVPAPPGMVPSRPARPAAQDANAFISQTNANYSTPTNGVFQKSVLARFSYWTSSSNSSTSNSSLPASMILFGCSTCGRTTLTKYHFKVSDSLTDTYAALCTTCRDRLVAVCEFYNFVRQLRQGLYSTRRVEDMYVEVLDLKRRMYFARSGLFATVDREPPFVTSLRGGGTAHDGMLRPDSVLYLDMEEDVLAPGEALAAAAVSRMNAEI